ncbi:MAG: GAF domain-containing protein [Chloroflexi bacterium]|nr:GAF domain-containing protein [Chloroflexota bacterium]
MGIPGRYLPNLSSRIFTLLAIIVLLVCLYYTFAAAYLAPYPGFYYRTDWIVGQIPACEAPPAWCLADQNTLQLGDQLLTIGALTYDEFQRDRTREAFAGYNPGDFVPITFRRGGVEHSLQWQMLGPTLSYRFNRLSGPLFYLPFWLAGVLITLLLRPHDLRWRLLILFNFTTAIWLAAGLVSYLQVAYSSPVLHALSWLIVPIYLHLHLNVPSPIFPRMQRALRRWVYPLAILLAILELFQILPRQLYYLGLLIAILGSLGLLFFRYLTHPSPADRLALRLLLAGIALAFGPGMESILLPALLGVPSSNLAVGVATFAIPVLPFFYIYAIYKRRLGGLEFRANRLLSLYGFVILYGTLYILVFPLGNRWSREPTEFLAFNLLLSLVFVLSAIPLRPRFQRLVDRLAYGTAYNPDEILRVFADQIPRALERETLAELLTQEVAPNLLIRESALYLLTHTSFDLVYASGMTTPPNGKMFSKDGHTFAEQEALLRALWQLLAKAGKYRPPDAEYDGEFGWVRLAIALEVRGQTIGVWLFGRRDPDDFYPESDIRLLQTLASQVTAALENIRLFAETQRRLQHLAALHAIDGAVSTSRDLDPTLNILLDQVTTHLGVDAADVLLLDPQTQILEFAAGRGFSTDALKHTRLRWGEGHAGHAVQERRIVSISNLIEDPGDFIRSPQLLQEAFLVYFGAPLIAKGQVRGVLEIFHRGGPPLGIDPEWLNFLEALASLVAIAIDNAELFDGLQRANKELAEAYDTTLEGWSRALDLRDQETEGHTRRVTEVTLRLARSMGMPAEELEHVRRGALLHDIGKIAIPDSVLLKPGPFTDAEWKIMQQHTIYAYELLSPIAYLRPALDIPYCHHEKWDGTGYPRGLKDTEIPLAARIFAVVDVWDALRSDRPYRPAWPEEKAREYIRDQAGKHFDPQIAEMFLKFSTVKATTASPKYS